jgi:hypothetical protein
MSSTITSFKIKIMDFIPLSGNLVYDIESKESKKQYISEMKYPSRGTIFLKNIDYSIVFNAIRTFSSLNIIDNCKKYRIVFPAGGFKFPELSNKTYMGRGHSYPVCSCSYGKLGLCKHLKAIGMNKYNIDWNNYPDNLQLLLKKEGLVEFQ